ncbi:MAG: hypothetical protein ICV67_03290 [Thermoleophilia bacterium]|nr:hypothetical protein [Thermoleophilia bacterium]
MRLGRVDVPGEHEARERTWAVVRAAFGEREPAPARPRRLLPAVALAVLAAAVAAAVTPPGRAVVDRVREALGVETAEQALFSLPAGGRLLVVSDSGAWLVSRDGSRRRLGDYRVAACSPFGRFVAAARERELAALEPDGEVRWTLARNGITDVAWGGTATDTRIAYLAGGTLRVVAGDGTGDHALGPADGFRWLPGARHRLAVIAGRRTTVVDADTGAVVAREPLLAPRSSHIRQAGGTSRIVVGRDVRFEGSGTFRDATPSPDGRWLAFVWPEVDQLVFVTASGRRELEATANLTNQFDAVDTPHLADWCPAAE